MRVLIVKLTSLGDIVFNLPVVSDIQAHFPGAVVDWAVDSRFEELPRACAGVSDVFSFPFRNRYDLSISSFLIEVSRSFRALRTQRYDAIIDTQGMIKSAAVCLMAKAKHKYGYSRPELAESLLSWAYNQRISRHVGPHVVVRYRKQVGEALGFEPKGQPNFGLAHQKPDSAPFGPTSHEQAQLRAAQTIIFFPFASHARKCLPAELGRQFIARMQAEGLSVAIPSGSAREVEQAQLLIGGTNARLMPAMSIAELARVFGLARGFVGADTGLTHLAAAVGLPTVAVFKATRVERLGPHLWAPHARSVDLAMMGAQPEQAATDLSLQSICTALHQVL